MNDHPINQAPMPPKAPSPVFMPKDHTSESVVHSMYDDNFAADFNLPAGILKTKPMAMIMGGVLCVGLILGAMMFGGSESTQQQSGGLQGVVRNIDLDKQYPRCGVAEKGQACILYIMNSSRYDKTGEDFFDEAVRLTTASKYSISMVNTRYAKQIIRPGYIAQIKIPNIR